MIKENIYEKLSQETIQDKSVGINIALLLEADNKQTFYATCLEPGQSINPHYHQNGAEIYYIISGYGTIHTTNVKTGKIAENKVSAGDIFKIDPKIIHQLKNISAIEQLFLLFVCDPSHISYDRIVVK